MSNLTVTSVPSSSLKWAPFSGKVKIGFSSVLLDTVSWEPIDSALLLEANIPAFIFTPHGNISSWVTSTLTLQIHFCSEEDMCRVGLCLQQWPMCPQPVAVWRRSRLWRRLWRKPRTVPWVTALDLNVSRLVCVSELQVWFSSETWL